MMCSQSGRWQGSSTGFQWPSVTFPDSTPHPPPFAAAVSTKSFSRHLLLPRVTWCQAFLFSLARVVGLRLTRPLVLLKSTHFRILKKKLGSLLRKKKYACEDLQGSFCAIARDSQTSRSMDRQLASKPALDVSFSFVFSLRPFLPHNCLLTRTYACLPFAPIPGRPLLHIVSCSLLVPTPLPVWSFLFAFLHFSCKLLTPAFYPSFTCKLIISFFSGTLALSFIWSILNSRQSWGLEVGEERKKKMRRGCALMVYRWVKKIKSDNYRFDSDLTKIGKYGLFGSIQQRDLKPVAEWDWSGQAEGHTPGRVKSLLASAPERACWAEKLQSPGWQARGERTQKPGAGRPEKPPKGLCATYQG